MKQVVPRVFLAAALAGLSAYLLKGDVWTFWTWWMLAFLMGMLAMPVTGRLFAGFEDKGWIFSKVLAIAVTGFLTWLLVAVKLLPFTTVSCIGVSVVCGILCILLYFYQIIHNGFLLSDIFLPYDYRLKPLLFLLFLFLPKSGKFFCT